ncbi:hypothetical protein JB92DRAFT_2835155 [Gautieria morchelliformis]|nr:hypothetical protein JB92DRAFT_2835155 [Gautieria morchelliformis]
MLILRTTNAADPEPGGATRAEPHRAGNDEGARVVSELEAVGVATAFSVVRGRKGVPAAWGTKTVTCVAPPPRAPRPAYSNHNLLPDMTHDEFVACLGPVLAPETYAPFSLPLPPVSAPSLPTLASPAGAPCPQCPGPDMPLLDWMHLECCAAQMTPK